MSFSSNVKNELLKKTNNARHCNISELAAIINNCSIIDFSTDNAYIKIQTEKFNLIKRVNELIKNLFGFETEFVVEQKTNSKKRTYLLELTDYNIVYNLLLATSVLFYDNELIQIKKRIYPLIVKNECCKKAYIRGAFLCNGSISDPRKTYHLEFVSTSVSLSFELVSIINHFGLHSKIIKRKDNFVVYLKEGEQIVDLLNIIGAHNSLLEFENVRVFKDMRNNVNRIVNCEAANINKTVKASIVQIENINFINEEKGLSFLSEQLEEVAKIRLSFPESSLKEIGEILSPPVSKSGVNHRLRKINEIAESLKGGKL